MRGDRCGQPRRHGSEGGFALAVVVFLLFAIAVAAATGYRVVQTEAQLAVYSADATKALAIAHEGAQRVLGQTPPDLSAAVTLSIGGGEATVSTRRVFRPWFPNELRLLTSRGTFADPRFANLPAQRTVRQYVRYRRAPLNVLAAVVSTGSIVSDPGFELDGTDPSTCPAGRTVPETLAPAPLSDIDVPWSELMDPGLVVDDDSFPLSSTGPEYRLMRVMGNLLRDTGAGHVEGKGILIVEGDMTIRAAFRWEGIVLVGGDVTIDIPPGQPFGLIGTVVGGLSDPTSTVSLEAGKVLFDSCEILAAGARLARLEGLGNTWWEVH